MKTINSAKEWKEFMKTEREVGTVWKVNFGKLEWQVQMPKGLATFGTLKEAQDFSSGYLKTI